MQKLSEGVAQIAQLQRVHGYLSWLARIDAAWL